MPGMPDPKSDLTDQLLTYLAQQRYNLKLTAYGLSDHQARSTPTTSTLSIGGLIKHSAWCERGWFDMASGRTRTEQPDYVEQFTLTSDETIDDVIALYDEVAAESEETVAELGLAHRFANPKGVPWFPEHVDEWDVRWLLLHLVEEVGRHAGHADIIRETIDGRQMGDIVAEVEGWVMPDWV